MSAEQPSAILATTSGMRMLADGTIRLSFDFEPRHGKDAFALFGAPGTPVAVARIMPEVAQQQARQEAAEPAKGGVLAKLAGMWCADELFNKWIAMTHGSRMSGDAAEFIRMVCRITSRAELDHNEAAAALFHSEFRLPYNAWLQGRR